MEKPRRQKILTVDEWAKPLGFILNRLNECIALLSVFVKMIRRR